MPAPLAERRKAAGLSQQTLASRAKCSIATVSLLERGYIPESSDVLDRIERVLAKAAGEMEQAA